MAKGDKLLERMRDNPRDWGISEVERVCHAFGIDCAAPRGGGSHYKVKHLSQVKILTVPAHRPIREWYIDDLVDFVDAVKEATK